MAPGSTSWSATPAVTGSSTGSGSSTPSSCRSRPFGMGTVSRQVLPGLPEFLYSLSKAQGADQTLVQYAGDQYAARNGEPYGEAGLVTQKDDEWQEQTGGPRDPQPGGVPGGTRDVLRAATFDDATLQGFFVDSGSWTVSGGSLKVAASSLGKDAAAVFFVDDYLPIYYELAAVGAGPEADRRVEGERLHGVRLLQPDRLQVRRPRHLHQQAGHGLPRRHRLARGLADPEADERRAVLLTAAHRQRHHRHPAGQRHEGVHPHVRGAHHRRCPGRPQQGHGRHGVGQLARRLRQRQGPGTSAAGHLRPHHRPDTGPETSSTRHCRAPGRATRRATRATRAPPAASPR